MLDQLVVLDSDIYFGQGLTVAVVEIAELDPFVHETQGDLVVILFVLGDLVVIVNSSGFVHHLSIILFEALDNVDDHEYYKSYIKGPNQCESKPS